MSKFFLGFLVGLILVFHPDPLLGQDAPPQLDGHVSYFNGLLVVFGFVIGVWLTVILMIAASWHFRRQDQPPARDGSGAEDGVCAVGHDPEGADRALMLNMGLLRDILKGMNDQVERLDPDVQPDDPKAKSALVQGELEGLLSRADRLVNTMEEEVHEVARREQSHRCFGDGTEAGFSGESPQYAEMHTRARNLRADGCRLLTGNRCREAASCFEESWTLLRELASADPENQLWQRDLVLSYHNLGRALEAQERYQEALDYFDEALSLAGKQVDQNPGNLDWKRGLAASHSHVGRILSLLGNQDGARRNFDKEISLMNYMLQKQPGNKAWQYALASAYHNMGQLLERRGQVREALEVFKKDQAVLKQLVAGEPGNVAWLYDLACVHGQMARMYKEQGRLKDALGNARLYLGAMRRLSERDPDNTVYRRELTVALGQVGRLLELRGDYGEARNTFKATLEMRRNLAELDPYNPVWQDDLLVCLYKIGDVCFAQKDNEEAWRYYQEALDLVDSLIARDGLQDNWMMNKCGVLFRLGNLHQAHDAGTAANYYQSALTIAEQPHPASAKEGDWRELTGLIKKNISPPEQVAIH